ncbi:MAG: choice-of-anchor L domain-containing protein [Polyangiaceae bacterium]
MKIPFALGFIVVLTVGAACSSGSPPAGFTGTGSSGSSSGSGAGSSSGGGSGSSSGAVPILGGDSDGGASSSGGGGTVVCNVTDPNADMDKDGWSPNQGDCNDCDPNVNPGAIDVLHQADGGAPYWGNEDCSGKPGDNAMPCDTGLTLADVDPNDAAKAIELCATTTTSERTYGVISAAYVRADGTAFAAPGLQVGIQSAWGSNVHVQGGANMLAMSSGYARSVGQAGACNGISCEINATATAPTGFPEDDPACPPTTAIADDVALELQIRVPTNATGYSFNFKFYSFEFPDWVCDTKGYNDQFIALVTPPPTGAYVPSGSTGGNISFDSNGHPVSVNMGYFDVCDPTTPQRFAQHCKATTGATCPATPSPYCPLGTGDLAGTGFDVWQSSVGPDGATRWLQTQAPATPGSIITIRFAIWDAGNQEFDSTVLIDNFQWNATGGTVAVGTTPVPTPK